MAVEAKAEGRAALDRSRIAALTEREMAKLTERTPSSKQRYERGVKVMPGGVPSSFQENDPWPVYLERGEGARVWDVDGHEYVDFHNGFGVMCIGHANPTVSAAVKARIDLGTHFAAPTEGSIAVAEELSDRFGLPQWRFTNSGTESTMDAVHLARGRHGPRRDPEDRGLLSRPPRRGDGLRLSRARGPGRARRPALGPLRRRLSARPHRAHPGGALQRRRGARAGAGQDRRPGRRDDHGAGDDEHQHHPARRRLSRAGPRAHSRARRDADLRRGEDRGDDRPRRRHPALRRGARHDHPGEGDLRRLPRRGDRDERRGRRADLRRPRASIRDLQRQPPGDGRSAGDPDGGADRRRLRSPRELQPLAARRLRRGDRALRPALLHRSRSAPRAAWSSPRSRFASIATT